ncbi:MAG: 2-oxoacid:acceptor oxidoreductase family protein [Bacteriovoracaceae bacterium]|nr:2-oxoacid:acceptor oxidoreductase family protein [Bacteriovoracaceae bacterium]
MMYKILNGNELLIEGGLEAGFDLYTGYPGSPLADFFGVLEKEKKNLAKDGIHVVIANSEANAAAMASGAKMAGKNVLLGMKSMGLHVASDALSVGNFANPAPSAKSQGLSGVVVAVGDDPWSISTSTPADSRYLYKHLHMPFLEPSTPQELKDWMKVALTISQDSSVYCGLLLTTFMAEGGGRVEIGTKKVLDSKKVELDPEHFDLSEHVMVPPNSLKADRKMILERFPRVEAVLKKLSLDKVYGNEKAKIGFLSSGATFEILKHVLEENDLMDKYSLYKVATPFPLNESQLLPYLENLAHVVVVEEKRGFLETEIHELVHRNGLKLEIFGKKFQTSSGFPAFGGLNYEIVFERILTALSLLEKKKNILDLTKIQPVFDVKFEAPKRLPTFCPGCPHRETLSLLKDIRADFKREGIKLISHGDVGCYSLSFLEPFKEMHDLSAMGQGGALGAGTDIFTSNPSVVLMGDSTFFHSGMTNISNSVQIGHSITYILLDNDNTAMTGHQVTPRTGLNVEGQQRPRQSIIDIVKAMKVNEVVEVNPSDRYFYKNLLLDFIKKPGVKVVVSNKECALTYFGRKKSEERKFFAEGKTQEVKSFYQINTFACEDCRACVEMTGCPGLSQTEDAYGTKVKIDPQICVSDSYCTKIKACPSFELVQVTDYHPTKYYSTSGTNHSLPLPKETVTSLNQIAKGRDFRVVVTGVGGTGVTTISRILAEAAKDMDGHTDLDFKFVEQKGLAQRNGSVTGHLSIFKKGQAHSQITPVASADLVLSPDLLEAARNSNFLRADGMLVSDTEFQMPLSLLLDKGLEADPMTQAQIYEKLIHALDGHCCLAFFKEKSFSVYQKNVYASAMILGFVFQMGRLPFSLKNLEEAFQRAVPKIEFENNWQAFQTGRKFYLDKEYNKNKALKNSIYLLDDYVKSMEQSLYFWQSKKVYRGKFLADIEKVQKLAPSLLEKDVFQYVHDFYVFDHGKKLPSFLSLAASILSKYSDTKHIQLVFRILAKTYWIKDEVFVAHQLTSQLKYLADQKSYAQLGTKFKVTHINRPHFNVGPWKIEFDINSRDWMLEIMKHMRILRNLLPKWHAKEKYISSRIVAELTETIASMKTESERYMALKKLDNIKGYRNIRYQKAREYFNDNLI